MEKKKKNKFEWLSASILKQHQHVCRKGSTHTPAPGITWVTEEADVLLGNAYLSTDNFQVEIKCLKLKMFVMYNHFAL